MFKPFYIGEFLIDVHTDDLGFEYIDVWDHKFETKYDSCLILYKGVGQWSDCWNDLLNSSISNLPLGKAIRMWIANPLDMELEDFLKGMLNGVND